MVNSYKKNRGQILVLVAISLVVLLGFAALAIDIGYFYHTKNQLQGAADAAALAGAVKLDGTNDPIQPDARHEAITYAELNSASGSPVHLSNDDSNVLAKDNGINDITVGSWAANTYTAGGTPVNAVQVRARSTNKDAAGFPRIFGKIFDTTKQEIQPEAIAARPARSSTFFYFCDIACSSTTSLPRILSTDTSAPFENQFAWTSLTDPVTNASDLSAYICAESPFVDNCKIPLYSTTGTAASVLRDLEARMYDPTYESNMKDIIGGKIYGWWVIVPVISPCPPGKQPAPQPVTQYANIHIKAICSSSASSPACGQQKLPYNHKDDGPPVDVCKPYTPPNDIIIIDQIQCYSCGDPNPPPGYKSVLVK